MYSCEAFVHVRVPATPCTASTFTLTTASSHHAFRLFSKEDDVPGEDEVATFYSPNAALDPTKFRYDLEEEDTTGSSSDEGDESSSSSINPDFNEYSFFDEATIFVRAGSGGQGASTYRKGVGGQNGQPDGGNGGRGGDVILEVDDSLNTLAGLTDAWRPNAFGGGGAAKTGGGGGGGGGTAQSFRPKSFRAENGQDGIRQFKTGRYGKDAVVRVPPGTVVQEEIDIIDEIKLAETGERVVLRTEKHDLGIVTVEEPTLIVALGGEGGEGSATTGKKAGRGVRRPRSPPIGGERGRLKLTLKIVADVALVGVPNAGKSTFLASVTRAKPKIANYPFTTVVPNLGVWVPPNSDGYISDAEGGSGSAGLVLCDVPGLIAGAAEGVGLGHAFLRHVERCHVILHLVDATSADPVGDFDMLNREILRYGNGKLARMPQIAVVNKVDAWEEGKGEEWEQGLRVRMSKEELEEKLRATMTHSRLMWMSAKEGEGVDDLMGRMAMFVRKVKEANEES